MTGENVLIIGEINLCHVRSQSAVANSRVAISIPRRVTFGRNSLELSSVCEVSPPSQDSFEIARKIGSRYLFTLLRPSLARNRRGTSHILHPHPHSAEKWSRKHARRVHVRTDHKSRNTRKCCSLHFSCATVCLRSEANKHEGAVCEAGIRV